MRPDGFAETDYREVTLAAGLLGIRGDALLAAERIPAALSTGTVGMAADSDGRRPPIAGRGARVMAGRKKKVARGQLFSGRPAIVLTMMNTRSARLRRSVDAQFDAAIAALPTTTATLVAGKVTVTVTLRADGFLEVVADGGRGSVAQYDSLMDLNFESFAQQARELGAPVYSALVDAAVEAAGGRVAVWG